MEELSTPEIGETGVSSYETDPILKRGSFFSKMMYR
jgi:hypothetical protein